MPKRILIVDDDVDFNNLLTDVFLQANYEVQSVTDAEKALALMELNAFDLVVTDQRMPVMTGLELIKAIKTKDPEVPIIMVSGYLDNRSIRELIREGVGGIFLKPLNIFSLLKKTTELIDLYKKGGGRTIHHLIKQRKKTGETQFLPFAFQSFPGKSKTSADFAKKLHNIRDFKNSIILVGDPGTDFTTICEDLVSFNESGKEALHVFKIESLNENEILKIVRVENKKGIESLLIMIECFSEFGESAAQTIMNALRRESIFKALSLSLRYVFCVHCSLDSLYEEGYIDDNLYISMGTHEIIVPPLRECQEDLPLMARSIIGDACAQRGIENVTVFDDDALVWLKNQSWEQNYEEFEKTLLDAFDMSEHFVISEDDLRDALNFRGSRPIKSRLKSLKSHLKNSRDDLVKAAWIMAEKDCRITAMVLGMNEILVRKIVLG